MPSPEAVVLRVDAGPLSEWTAAVLRRVARAGRGVVGIVEAPSDAEHGGVFGVALAADARILGFAHDPDARGGDATVRVEALEELPSGGLLIDLSTAGGKAPPGYEIWRVLVEGHPVISREPYFWLTYKSRRTCEVTLECTSVDGDITVLTRAVAGVDRISIARTRGPILWKAVEMIGRAFERSPVRAVEVGTVDAVRGDCPGALHVAVWCLGVLVKVTRRRIRKAFGVDRWHLGLRPAVALPANGDELVQVLTNGPAPTMLANPSGVSRADPFLFERDGATFLFFEEVHSDSPGRISVVELDGTAMIGAPTVCLAEQHHLSYPFVFEADEEIFLLAESSAVGRVDLYRAAEFPRVWTLARTVLNGITAVDPTLLRASGLWWLFVGVGAPYASLSEELSIYYSETLDADWTQHPQNPVVADVRTARPAGPFLRVGRDLIRPAQNGANGYGSSISLQRVVTLTPEAYREETVGSVSPAWLRGAHATHTYARNDRIEVTDGQKYVVRRPWRPGR